MVQIAPEKWGDIGPCLTDDEMIDIEEFCDAGERGVTVGVGGLAPGMECRVCGGGPGDDGAGFVLAF